MNGYTMQTSGSRLDFVATRKTAPHATHPAEAGERVELTAPSPASSSSLLWEFWAEDTLGDEHVFVGVAMNVLLLMLCT